MTCGNAKPTALVDDKCGKNRSNAAETGRTAAAGPYFPK